MVRDFYGFTKHPFPLTAGDGCYFESLSQRQAITRLGYALAQGEGVVLVTGGAGIGKSTLIAHLLATIDRSLVTASSISCGNSDADAVIAAMARAFDQPTESRPCGDLDTIERFLQGEAQAGRRVLAVLDDAQDLSIAALEALRQLSDFRHGGQAVAQFVLAGSPELRNRLNSNPLLEPLRQRVIASQRLDPLEPAEVEPYIRHRLTGAGWTGNPSFAPRLFTEIHAATAGVPGRVNQIVGQLLLLGAAGQHQHIDTALLSQILAELTGPAPQGNLAVTSVELSANTIMDLALARCEGQIAELQRAIGELVGQGDELAHPAHLRPDHAALNERLGSLESRVIEQERTIRHTLTMLIDWIERDEAHSVAA